MKYRIAISISRQFFCQMSKHFLSASGCHSKIIEDIWEVSFMLSSRKREISAWRQELEGEFESYLNALKESDQGEFENSMIGFFQKLDEVLKRHLKK